MRNHIKVSMAILLLSSTVAAENNSTKKAVDAKYEIFIQGNKGIEDKSYLDALGVSVKSFYEFWKDDHRYISASGIPTIKDTLKDFLDSKGYYDAKISVNKASKSVKVNIQEGSPVLVGKVGIDSDFNIGKVVTFKKGHNFEASKFVSIKKNIKELLMKSGYCKYNLDTKAYVDLVKHSVELKYIVKKGELCYFGDTTITSKPNDISSDVVESRLQYKKGDVFSTAKIVQSFDMLNQLDAFGSGTVSPAEHDGNIVPMEVALSPKENLNVFRGGVGYDVAVGLRAQLFYERRNFLGDARKLTVAFHHSDKSKYGELSILSPAILSIGGVYFDLFAEWGYSNYIYDTYEENKGYNHIKLGYNKDKISFFAGVAVENIDIKLESKDPSIIEGNFLLLYPFAEFVYDGRDSKINPKNGYYISAYSEYGIDYEPGSSSYLKFLLEGRFIKSFDDLTLAAVGKVGVIDILSGAMPASKLFYAGGSYSNRAYGEKDIGITTSPITSLTLGGKTWLNLSLEADYKIYGDLYGALFFDSTMINKDEYDFDGEIINAAGVGVRYMTPVGPVKLDVAVNIEDIKEYGIQFQIGQSF